MSGYQKIAVAVDLSKESAIIIRRALDIAGEGAELHLLYVQQPMEAVYMGVMPFGPVFVGMDEVEQNLRNELHAKLTALGDQFKLADGACHFLSGAPAREIHRFVNENNIDLVVLGTHGQKGVQLLLGSTANSVLHGSGCDVLAVRVRD
jgi:universal stress protein A